MRLMPAIDLRDGRCVRLLRGDFGKETRYPTAPLELAKRFEAMGADWLHVVDLDGAREGFSHRSNTAVISQLAAQSKLKLQVGGGLRTRADVAGVLNTGASRAVVGSTAVSDPEAVREWIDTFGAERITVAFDVSIDPGGTPRILTHGWQRESTNSLWEMLLEFPAGAPDHVLCTDKARDGALSGPNTDLYADAVRRFPTIAWQASGGIRNAADLEALASCGAAAAISGKALLDDLIAFEELAPYLPNA